MISIGIDVGKKSGIAVYDTDFVQSDRTVHSQPYAFTTLDMLYRDTKMLIDIYKPDIIISARPMGRNQQVIRFHSAMGAIIELVCEQKEVQYIEKPDNHLRKVVHGRGKMTKQEVIEETDADDEHQADAITAAMYVEYLTLDN